MQDSNIAKARPLKKEIKIALLKMDLKQFLLLCSCALSIVNSMSLDRLVMIKDLETKIENLEKELEDSFKLQKVKDAYKRDLVKKKELKKKGKEEREEHRGKDVLQKIINTNMKVDKI